MSVAGGGDNEVFEEGVLHEDLEVNEEQEPEESGRYHCRPCPTFTIRLHLYYWHKCSDSVER